MQGSNIKDCRIKLNALHVNKLMENMNQGLKVIMFFVLVIAFICSLPLTFFWLIYACAKANIRELADYYDGLFKL